MKTMRASSRFLVPRRRLKSSSGRFPSPGPAPVRIKVEACGICHSDSIVKEGLLPGIEYPRVPGHEVAGVIDAVGAGRDRVETRPAGRRRLARRQLRPLRRSAGAAIFSPATSVQATGITFDGGYAEYMVAPASAVALLPGRIAGRPTPRRCCAPA